MYLYSQQILETTVVSQCGKNIQQSFNSRLKMKDMLSILFRSQFSLG